MKAILKNQLLDKTWMERFGADTTGIFKYAAVNTKKYGLIIISKPPRMQTKHHLLKSLLP